MATEIFSEAPAQTGPIRGARRALSPGRLAALLTVLVVLAAAFAASYVHSSAWRDARSDAFDRLGLYEASLRAAFGRFDYLPDLVARLDAVTALAAGAGDADAVNRLLESLAERSEADVIYVLDAEGLTRASSNHGEPTSFVGENYAFRPYYQEAISGRTGRFFAVGATTGRPGYFVAEPIRIGAGIAGVAVVKIEVDSLQRDWQQAGEMVFVTDADGIVFLASRPEFLYRTVRPLSQDQRARIAVARQYAGAALEPLAFAVPIGTGTMEVEGRSLLHVEEPLAALGWTVHVAVPLQGARERALLAALGILVAGSLAVTSILVAGQRAMKRESALMRDANRALAGEVAERRRLPTLRV